MGLLLTLGCVWQSVTAAVDTGSVVNERVTRTFFAQKQVIRGTYTIRAKNTASQGSVSEYLLAMPKIFNDHLAYIQASDNENQQLRYRMEPTNKVSK